MNTENAQYFARYCTGLYKIPDKHLGSVPPEFLRYTDNGINELSMFFDSFILFLCMFNVFLWRVVQTFTILQSKVSFLINAPPVIVISFIPNSIEKCHEDTKMYCSIFIAQIRVLLAGARARTGTKDST